MWIGAAVGPLIAGTVSDYGWENVFYMLMVADVIALVVRIWFKYFIFINVLITDGFFWYWPFESFWVF